MTEDSDQTPKDLIGFLDHYLVRKAPFQIPDGGREWIVRYGPWIMLVLLVLTLPAVLIALGIGTFLVPFGGLGYATGFGFLTLFILAATVLRALSLPGLFARKMSGWQLAFYAQIVDFVGGLLSRSIIGAIVGALIGMYILFQIRSLYTAGGRGT
ncbi:MAG TPA: hypothetical protein VF981_17355 [Gemmatimonadaceae bacterium]